MVVDVCTMCVACQDCLGGSSRCYLIVTLSSSAVQSRETLNTLDFASRAKKVKNVICVQSEEDSINTWIAQKLGRALSEGEKKEITALTSLTPNANSTASPTQNTLPLTHEAVVAAQASPSSHTVNGAEIDSATDENAVANFKKRRVSSETPSLLDCSSSLASPSAHRSPADADWDAPLPLSFVHYAVSAACHSSSSLLEHVAYAIRTLQEETRRLDTLRERKEKIAFKRKLALTHTREIINAHRHDINAILHAATQTAATDAAAANRLKHRILAQIPAPLPATPGPAPTPTSAPSPLAPRSVAICDSLANIAANPHGTTPATAGATAKESIPSLSHFSSSAVDTRAALPAVTLLGDQNAPPLSSIGHVLEHAVHPLHTTQIHRTHGDQPTHNSAAHPHLPFNTQTQAAIAAVGAPSTTSPAPSTLSFSSAVSSLLFRHHPAAIHTHPMHTRTKSHTRITSALPSTPNLNPTPGSPLLSTAGLVEVSPLSPPSSSFSASSFAAKLRLGLGFHRAWTLESADR